MKFARNAKSPRRFGLAPHLRRGVLRSPPRFFSGTAWIVNGVRKASTPTSRYAVMTSVYVPLRRSVASTATEFRPRPEASCPRRAVAGRRYRRRGNKPVSLRGFTLVEMIIVIVVFGVLAAATVPSFRSLMRDTRISTNAQKIHQALFLARSEAGKRGQVVALESTSGNLSWKEGWKMYQDTDGDGNQDPDEPDIRVGGPIDGTFTFTASAATARYLPSGFLSVAPTQVTFTFCDDGATGEEGRSIVVAQTGRPSISEFACL